MHTENLSVGYAAGTPLVLFEGLNLQLSAGELVCFMGPNGIGKSTLMRTLAGLHQPIDGKVVGVDVKSVALVLTERVATTNMTVHELVGFGRYPYLNWSAKLSTVDEQKVDEALAMVHLTYLSAKKINELSDGQMQMVMIARALAQETPYLLLDEPTAHLDLNNRVEIMKLLRTLARTAGKSILVATHELDLALQMADVIWLATRNKEVITGMPEDLVLSGAFDEVFQLKGFDLKTGKVFHEPFRNRTVKLEGTGPVYLWTKNALERNGFTISDTAALKIAVSEQRWKLNEKEFTTISGLLTRLLQFEK
ncbi:MAG: ABC transporter ATP-binding protein [Bacteroidetes bacterium]|nr:ABC transporter ATP-binding protein [Bacteroidota bacterium]